MRPLNGATPRRISNTCRAASRIAKITTSTVTRMLMTFLARLDALSALRQRLWQWSLSQTSGNPIQHPKKHSAITTQQSAPAKPIPYLPYPPIAGEQTLLFRVWLNADCYSLLPFKPYRLGRSSAAESGESAGHVEHQGEPAGERNFHLSDSPHWVYCPLHNDNVVYIH